MKADGGNAARTATLVATGAHMAGVVALVALGPGSDGPLVGWQRPLATAVVYLSPAVLALVSLRGRGSLLLAAATAALVLTVVPFSLHSLVLGPIGLIYLAAYAQSSGSRRGGPLPLAAVAVSPLLALAALVVLLAHDDPACYAQLASGEVTVTRGPIDGSSGEFLAAGSDVVLQACTSDTVVGWEAAGSLALSAAVVIAGLLLVPAETPGDQVDAAEPRGLVG